MDLYLSGRPWLKRLIDIGEWVIIIVMYFLFPYPKLPDWIGLKLFGGALIIFGLFLHRSAHTIHSNAHLPKEEIKQIVTSGIYSKIRHPCYVVYFLSYFGIFFIFGSLSMLIPIIFFSYSLYHSAVKEEEFLKEKFGKQYEEYTKKVPFRFIPKII